MATEALPHVTLKAAVTLDGRTAARSGESKWITGEAARKQAHRMRARVDAVLVGIGTVLADDPELTVRAVRGRTPLRVVLDSRLRLPIHAKLVRSARQHRTLVLHGPRASVARQRALLRTGVELALIPRARTGASLDLRAALAALAQRGVARVLVEGGAQVHGALLAQGLVDYVAVFVAPCIVADDRAYPLAAGDQPVSLREAWRLTAPRIRRFGDDVLIEGQLGAKDRKPAAAKSARARKPKRAAGARARGPRRYPGPGRTPKL